MLYNHFNSFCNCYNYKNNQNENIIRNLMLLESSSNIVKSFQNIERLSHLVSSSTGRRPPSPGSLAAHTYDTATIKP